MTIELPPGNDLGTENGEEPMEHLTDRDNMEADNTNKNMTEDGALRKLWDHFSSTSGFHGFNRISFRFERTSMIRSLVWLVAWLVCSVYVIYLLITELKYYYSYPTETNTRFFVEYELSFPAITVCDLRNLNAKSFLNDSRIRDAHEWWQFHKFNQINWSDLIYEQEGFFKNRSIEDLIEESKTFMALAYFDGKYFHEFVPVITDIGLCVRMNGDGVWRTSQYGQETNLYLLIGMSNKDDYVYNADWFNYRPGVKVAIHDPREEPIMKKEGIVLHSGTISAIEIQRQEQVFLPAPYKASGNRFCNNTPGYSYNMCLTDCGIRVVEMFCGCKPMISNNSEGPFCSKHQDFTCASEELNYLWPRRYTCLCTHRCEFTMYSKTRYTDEFPSSYDDIVAVNVYYSDITVVKYEQVPKYHDVGALLANIGGQLGLFVGASVLTLMEVLELFLFICLHLCSARRNKPNELDKNERTNVV